MVAQGAHGLDHCVQERFASVAKFRLVRLFFFGGRLREIWGGDEQ